MLRPPFLRMRIASRIFLPRRSFSATRVQKATAEAYNSEPPSPSPRSFLRRFAGASAIFVLFTGVGFVMAAGPAFEAVGELFNPPTDAETLHLFQPYDGISQEVEDYINTHPLVLQLRANLSFRESRPHLKIPPTMRARNLTAGILTGERKIVVPPFAWTRKGDPGTGELPELVSISYFGHDLSGHPGILHGGLLATILDEGMVKACVPALPNHVGMTANLNINYRAPAIAGNYLCLRAKTIKVEGRKAWVEGSIETLVDESKGEKPVKLVEATALVIEPRQAAGMAKIMPID